MLNFFKKKNNKVVSDLVLQQEKTESLNIHFDYNTLPKNKRIEKIYLDKWLKNDGAWIEKGQPLYTIRVGDRIRLGQSGDFGRKTFSSGY